MAYVEENKTHQEKKALPQGTYPPSQANRSYFSMIFLGNTNNESGFLFLTLATLLPLLLTMMCFLAALAYSLLSYQKSHHLCRTHFLEFQDQIRLQIFKMKKLNPKATFLRKKAQRAQEKLNQALATGNPLKISVALAFKARVLSQQLRLKALQSRIKNTARIISLQSQRILKDKFRQTVASSSNLHISKIPFSLVPFPSNSLTPNYVPSLRFKERQRAYSSWKLLVSNFIPTWMQSFLNLKYELVGQCASTINNGEPKWAAELTN